MATKENRVFWYYAGNRPVSAVIEGMPTLASPHKFLLAPAGQKWPPASAHLFRRKTPPKEIRDQFGESGRLAEARQKEIDAETAKARREKAEAEKAKAAAARKGGPSEKLEMHEAVQEKGAATPPTTTPPASTAAPSSGGDDSPAVSVEGEGSESGSESNEDGQEQDKPSSSRSRRSRR